MEIRKADQISGLLSDCIRINDNNFISSLESFLDNYKKTRSREVIPNIPILLFSTRKLGILEVTVKHLKENYGFSFSTIAFFLNRDHRTIWISYRNACNKQNEQKLCGNYLFENNIDIPINIFTDRTVGPLESLVIYLKEDCNFSYGQIAKTLNRNYGTIWLSYKKGVLKKNK